MTASTTKPQRRLDWRDLSRKWESLPEAARVAIALAVILAFGAITISFLGNMADRPTAQQTAVAYATEIAAQSPPIMPTTVEAPPVPASQPQPVAAAAAVELVMFHDITAPATTFTVTTDLTYVNGAVIGYNSQSPGCYLVDFGETQAWTCDSRVEPVEQPTIDYGPQPTAIPVAPVPVYNPPAPVYAAPQAPAPAVELPTAPVTSGREEEQAAPPRPTVDNGTGSAPRPPRPPAQPTEDNGLGGKTRP